LQPKRQRFFKKVLPFFVQSAQNREEKGKGGLKKFEKGVEKKGGRW